MNTEEKELYKILIENIKLMRECEQLLKDIKEINNALDGKSLKKKKKKKGE